jgi:hypothetical protein
MTTTGVGRLVAGALAALVAAGLLIGGLALVTFHAVAGDSEGFYPTGSEDLRTDTYAITSGDLELRAGTAARWTTIERHGTARVRATAIDGGDVFVGIAARDDVDRYLAGSAHVEAVSLAGEPGYDPYPGARRPAPPATQGFWAASASGPGRQVATWDVEGGDWAVVVMNADGSAVVAAQVDAGLKTGVLLPMGLGITGAGIVTGVLARALRADVIAASAEPAGPWGRGPAPSRGVPRMPRSVG